MSKAFTREDDSVAEDVVARRPTEGAVHLTAEGAQRMRDELNELQQQPQSPGNDRRIRELQLTLASATIVAPATANDSTVRFGATVVVRDSDGEQTYRLVGPAEAVPARGWITPASPLGQALLNKRVGDKVLFKFPAGEDTLEILSVS